MSDQPPLSEDASNVVESAGGTVLLDELPDAVVAIRVSGALDLALAPKLRLLVERATRSRPAVIVIDLSDVTFLGSVGMAELLRAKTHGAALRLVVCSRVVERPLSVTRLLDEFAVYPSNEAAVAG